MKNYLFLAFVILGSKSAISQWTDMITPASYHLYSIETVTDDLVYAGGSGGSLVRTTDAGESWELVSIGSTNWVKAIHFFNPLEGWIATSSGSSTTAHLLKTIDGGLSWSSALDTDEYSSMSWPTESTGFVGTWNGTVQKTIDGGLNWSSISLPTTNNIPYLQFLNTQDGFAVSTDYYLHRTQDGGSTWESFYHNGIRDIYFSDATNGFCIDSKGRIGKTTDGGQTFTYWQSPFIDYKLEDIIFIGPSNGFVVGGLDCTSGSCITKPVILTTNDGGITWYNDINHPLIGMEKGLYEIDVTPNGTPFIAGTDALVLKNESMVGVSNLSIDESPMVVPNPNSGNFSVSLPNSTRAVQIHSASGQLIYEQKTNIIENLEIVLQEIDGGMYFLLLQFEDGSSHVERFVVEQ